MRVNMNVFCHYSCDYSKRTYQCFAQFHLEVTAVPLCQNLLTPSGHILYT